VLTLSARIRLVYPIVLFITLALALPVLTAQQAAPTEQKDKLPLFPLAPDALRERVETLHGPGAPLVRGIRLLQADAVAHFFETRAFEPAWLIPIASDQIVEAIRNITRDGLRPADYHLEEIEALLANRPESPSPELEADLQILLTDAVAGLVDHVRYGRVKPVSLQPNWNIDPRFGAPPLDTVVARIAASQVIAEEIEAFKPNHFIYVGLKQALAEMTKVAEAGGWPSVPAGPAIKPGASNPRIVAVRRRLAATGDLPAPASTDSPV
jgi:murein L,D-transpeptidase YcbB/YkuD